MLVMTELDRREGVAEGGVLNSLLQATHASETPATVAEETAKEHTAPQSQSSTEAQADGTVTSTNHVEEPETSPSQTSEETTEPSPTEETQDNQEQTPTPAVETNQENELTDSGSTGGETGAETGAQTDSSAEMPEATTPDNGGDSTTEQVATSGESSDEGAASSATSDEKPAEVSEATFTPKENNARPRRLKDLEVGMELDGRVTSVALYGIFVDIGLGRDGLVHISEMSDKRIESPSELVKIGDSVQVRVKKVDLEERRISLTMRPQREEEEQEQKNFKRNEPDREALSQLKVGDIVTGSITGLAPFGAFVDIGVGKDGLVHISELADSRVERPEDAVQVGEDYSFKILEVDSEGNRISLSLRRAQRVQRMQQLSPGDILEGKVSGLAPFGAFVDIGVGRDGLVHISQLSNDRVGKVEDVVNVGDTISVRVLEVDPQSKRISLTMRPEEPPEPETPEETQVEEQVEEEPAAAEPPPPPPPPSPRKDGKQQREGKGRQRSGRGGSRSPAPSSQTSVEIYVSDDDPEEEFEGNATLEDLLSKFGSPNSYRKDKDRRRRVTTDDDEEDEEDRYVNRKKQREAIQRTLQQKTADDDE
jgi:predicted RNA-binding protein with RPS1 domain